MNEADQGYIKRICDNQDKYNEHLQRQIAELQTSIAKLKADESPRSRIEGLTDMIKEHLTNIRRRVEKLENKAEYYECPDCGITSDDDPNAAESHKCGGESD